MKSADLLHVVVDHAAFEGGGGGLAGEAGHLDVAEAVIGEARLPDFGASALEGVEIGGARRAQVGDVERAIGLQRFGMAQRDLGALGAGDAQTAPAHHVLAHIEDVDAGLEHLDADGA